MGPFNREIDNSVDRVLGSMGAPIPELLEPRGDQIYTAPRATSIASALSPAFSRPGESEAGSSLPLNYNPNRGPLAAASSRNPSPVPSREDPALATPAGYPTESERRFGAGGSIGPEYRAGDEAPAPSPAKPSGGNPWTVTGTPGTPGAVYNLEGDQGTLTLGSDWRKPTTKEAISTVRSVEDRRGYGGESGIPSRDNERFGPAGTSGIQTWQGRSYYDAHPDDPTSPANYASYLADKEMRQAAGIAPREGMAAYDYNAAKMRQTPAQRDLSTKGTEEAKSHYITSEKAGQATNYRERLGYDALAQKSAIEERKFGLDLVKAKLDAAKTSAEVKHLYSQTLDLENKRAGGSPQEQEKRASEIKLNMERSLVERNKIYDPMLFSLKEKIKAAGFNPTAQKAATEAYDKRLFGLYAYSNKRDAMLKANPNLVIPEMPTGKPFVMDNSGQWFIFNGDDIVRYP